MIVSASMYALFALSCIKGSQWIKQQIQDSKKK